MKRLLSIIALSFLLAGPAGAEIVTLKSGRVLEGTITEETEDGITIVTESGEMGVNRRMIESIKTGNEPPPPPKVYHNDEEALEFLRSTLRKYREIQTYDSDVELLVTGKEMNKATARGHVSLGRPAYYNITFVEKSPLRGRYVTQTISLWNAGDGPYFYWGDRTSFAKLKDDASAMDIGVTMTSDNTIEIPSLFYSWAEESGLLTYFGDKIDELKFLDDDELSGEPCRVLEGKIFALTFRLWVAKSDGLIRKYYSLGFPVDPNDPEFEKARTDRFISQFIDELVNVLVKEIDKVSLEITRTFTNVQVNTRHSRDDYQFDVPEGTMEKSSYEDMAGPQSLPEIRIPR